MWFRQLTFIPYQLNDPLPLENLDSLLQTCIFEPITKSGTESIGFISPLTKKALATTDSLYLESEQAYLLCVQKQTKVLPAPVIKEFLEDRLIEFEEKMGRKPYKSEKSQLKDEVTHFLLTQAFSIKKQFYIILDVKHKRILINQTSERMLDQLLCLLKDAIPMLTFKAYRWQNPPSETLSDWLKNDAPMPFELDNSCELKQNENPKAKISYTEHELSDEALRSQLERGQQVKKMGLVHQDSLSFVIDDLMRINKLKLLDTESIDSTELSGDPVIDAQTNLSLFSLSTRKLIADILKVFPEEEQTTPETPQLNNQETHDRELAEA